MAFDAQDVPPAAAARGLCNYWGYSTHSFYSPHPRYCVDPASAPQEFRALTDAMHAAGIGVLLDVVFNHTAEAGASGPVINFKALPTTFSITWTPATGAVTGTTQAAGTPSIATILW